MQNITNIEVKKHWEKNSSVPGTHPAVDLIGKILGIALWRSGFEILDPCFHDLDVVMGH